MPVKNPTITKEQAKQEMIKIQKDLGRVPKRNEFFELTSLKGCHKNTLQVLFGKNPYSSLVIFSGFELNSSLKKPAVKVSCKKCLKEFTKYVSEIKKSSNHFCSNSCSASYNNRLRIKTKNNKEINIKTTKITYINCKNCNKTFIQKNHKESSCCSTVCYMEQGMKKRIVQDSIKRRGANAYDTIRKNARTYSKYFYPLKCMLCNYDKCYEVCHVKDIKDFDKTKTVFDLNNKLNLIHLCPNCHWEFDQNLIDNQTITQAQNKYINEQGPEKPTSG